LRFITVVSDEREGAEVVDEVPEAGEQRLPAQRTDEKDAVKPGSSSRALPATVRFGSEGEGEGRGKRRVLTSDLGDT
jgi:hypothetical protein